ncbi:MAG: hypothetical protein IPJ77_00665 [Planctomycetes bacterium]|nr:hypothetical protein [Planctomycetota bacterium]
MSAPEERGSDAGAPRATPGSTHGSTADATSSAPHGAGPNAASRGALAAGTAHGARRAELETLGLRTDRARRGRAARLAAADALRDAAPWTLGIALVGLAWALVARAAPAWPALSPWLVLAAALAPIAVLLLARVTPVATRPLDAGEGLSRLDRELDLHERLRTAWELDALAASDPFARAAVSEGLAHVEHAYAHVLRPHERVPIARRAWLAPVAALLVILATAWLARDAARTDELAKHDGALPTPNTPRDARARDDAAAKRSDPPPAPNARDARAKEDANPRTPEERRAQAELASASKESTGKSGAGRSADAASTSSSSDSQGLPSSPTKPADGGEKPKASDKKTKPKKPREETAPAKAKPPQESGATAGRGTGSGSSKNPGSTDWASKDQVSNDEEPPLAEDAEVDDEESEDEARGGLQPSLRDRRPAVNRDLTIGFGNQPPPPDANGRGGPSEQKKSRGVASLVLGVPIPDHVKGRPNPGRTKITQERVEPRAEDALPITASARAPRAGFVGPLARPELEPWMRALVANYFLPRPTKKP